MSAMVGVRGLNGARPVRRPSGSLAALARASPLLRTCGTSKCSFHLLTTWGTGKADIAQLSDDIGFPCSPSGRSERISWQTSCPPPCGRIRCAHACKIASCDFVNLRAAVPSPTIADIRKLDTAQFSNGAQFPMSAMVGVRGLNGDVLCAALRARSLRSLVQVRSCGLVEPPSVASIC